MTIVIFEMELAFPQKYISNRLYLNQSGCGDSEQER